MKLLKAEELCLIIAALVDEEPENLTPENIKKAYEVTMPAIKEIMLKIHPIVGFKGGIVNIFHTMKFMMDEVSPTSFQHMILGYFTASFTREEALKMMNNAFDEASKEEANDTKEASPKDTIPSPPDNAAERFSHIEESNTVFDEGPSDYECAESPGPRFPSGDYIE